MKGYKDTFQRDRHAETVYSANTILALILERFRSIRSAVDVGCGVGTWLSVIRERGVPDILGIDGPWVKWDFLVIPQNWFLEWDLGDPLVPEKRFELAISLEVAEHLPPASAKPFVNLLADLSDAVFFQRRFRIRAARAISMSSGRITGPGSSKNGDMRFSM